MLLTAEQVAALLQVSPRTVWRLVNEGKAIPPLRVGGSTRWRRDEVEEWVKAGCPAVDSHDNQSRR